MDRNRTFYIIVGRVKRRTTRQMLFFIIVVFYNTTYELSKYYERDKLVHKKDCGLPYTFDDVMEIYNWLDNNTPKHELYLDSKWASYHYIVAKDLDTFNKKEYCLDINEIYSVVGTRYLIQGLKEAKKDLEIIYSHKPDKSSQTSP